MNFHMKVTKNIVPVSAITWLRFITSRTTLMNGANNIITTNALINQYSPNKTGKTAVNSTRGIK